MVRYPHTATLTYGTESFDSNGDPIGQTTNIELKGRYESKSGNKNLDYSGKFYTSLFNLAKPFDKDNSTLTYEGKKFKVVQLYPYQKHIEIWLQ